MKKIMFAMMFLGAFIFLMGCAKPKGTFINDNYTDSYMDVTWCGYNMGVGPYDYTTYEVDAGGGTAEVYSDLYGYWGSLYVTVPEDGEGGVMMYWQKSGNKSSADHKLMYITKKGTEPKDGPAQKGKK
jgi:hypothetical protein